jgi:hypothetical protein
MFDIIWPFCRRVTLQVIEQLPKTMFVFISPIIITDDQKICIHQISWIASIASLKLYFDGYFTLDNPSLWKTGQNWPPVTQAIPIPVTGSRRRIGTWDFTNNKQKTLVFPGRKEETYHTFANY